MHTLHLIIGNKNYSSWSLRAWLLLREFNIHFEDHPIELFDESATPILKQYSATGKVPVLVVNKDDISKQICINDSLSIGLFTNNYLTELDVWSGVKKLEIDPNNIAQQRQRSICQSIVSEMHSGLMGIRSEMPMNIRATAKIEPSISCLADINRIENIFEQCLKGKESSLQTKGYLFGEFTIADAFYAPVILRLQTYAKYSGITLRATTEHYINIMLNNSNVEDWIQMALEEIPIIKDDEVGEILGVKGILGTSFCQ